MSSINLSTPNTSSTPTSPGRWIVPKFGPPSVLQWESWDPISSLSGDKVLIRIIVGGIGGVENIQRAGGYPAPPATEPGFSPGYELVGEILALGGSVPQESHLAVGDRVAALPLNLGAHATHIVVPHTEIMRLEPNDDPIKIASLPINYMTSWGMLKHSGVHLPPGSTILIGSASGGLGTAVAQLVAAFDLGIRMIGTSSPSKFEYLRSLGVEPIDRHAPDLVEQVRHLTDGQGVDVAYDGVCSKESIQNSLDVVKKDGGMVVVFGVMGEIATDGSGMLKGIQDIFAERLQAPNVSFYRLDIEFPSNDGVKDFYAMVEKVRSGRLDPVVAKLFRLSEAVEAHEHLIDGSAVKGKMNFVVDASLAAKVGV